MDMPDLTQAILARTSGSPCARLRERACAFVDGELDPTSATLVAGHLDHCPTCTALVANLRAAKALLPAFAEVDPGPWFAARVRRACTRKAEPSLWSRLLHRPRIALETAYLGAALGLMGISVPLPGHPEGLGARPVAKALAPVKPGVSALARGLHAFADVFKQDAPPSTEPSKGSGRSAP